MVSILCSLRILFNESRHTFTCCFSKSCFKDFVSLSKPSLGRDLRLFFTMFIICCSFVAFRSARSILLRMAGSISSRADAYLKRRFLFSLSARKMPPVVSIVLSFLLS